MIHFQSGVWVAKLSDNTIDDPSYIPCARNFKAWVKRFSEATGIPITVFLMCPDAHLHTWDSVFQKNDQLHPTKFECDFSTAAADRHSPCGKPLFRNADHCLVGEENNRTKFKPLLLYPVFDIIAQLKVLLKSRNAYKRVTAYTELQKPTFKGVQTEIYHGQFFQMLTQNGFTNDDPLTLDLFLQLFLDWAKFTNFAMDKIGPCTGRFLNFLYPERFDDDKM